MKTFRPYLREPVLYALAIALCWSGWSGGVSPDGVHARDLMGVGGFGLIAFGARCLRKHGVWPIAMRSGMWVSGLGALAVLWPYPSRFVEFVWLTSAAGGAALLWAGYVSVSRFHGRREWLRRLTVCCVFLQAPWPVTPFIADQFRGSIDGLGLIVISFTFWYAPLAVLAIIGTLSLAVLSIIRSEGQDENSQRIADDLATMGASRSIAPGDERKIPSRLAPRFPAGPSSTTVQEASPHAINMSWASSLFQFIFLFMMAVPLATLLPIYTQERYGLFSAEGRYLLIFLSTGCGLLGAALWIKLGSPRVRLKTWSGLVSVLILSIAVIGINAHYVPRQIAERLGSGPEYAGVRASKWIERLGRSYIPNEIFGRSDRTLPEQALRQIGPAAVPLATDMLADEHWATRAGAASALGFWGAASAPAIPGLLNIVETDASPLTQEVAAETLQNLHEQAQYIVAHLEDFLNAPGGVPGEQSEDAYRQGCSRLFAAYAILGLDPENELALSTTADVLYSRVLQYTARDYAVECLNRLIRRNSGSAGIYESMLKKEAVLREQSYLEVYADIPNAWVKLDGKPMGVIPPGKPLEIVLSPEGNKDIEVGAEGYESQHRTLEDFANGSSGSMFFYFLPQPQILMKTQ